MWNTDASSRLRVGPAEIDFVTLHDAASAIASRQLRGAVHLCNAYTLALADERPDLAATLTGDAANLPDGTPLVWWAKRKGIDRAERGYWDPENEDDPADHRDLDPVVPPEQL